MNDSIPHGCRVKQSADYLAQKCANFCFKRTEWMTHTDNSNQSHIGIVILRGYETISKQNTCSI